MVPATGTLLPATAITEVFATTETVLLVEEDGPTRNLARVILEKSGYGVLEVESERECLAACAEHQGPIHLLITDVGTPEEVGGIELAKRSLKLRPDLKVLFVSLHPQEEVFADGPLPGAFLQRPFAAVGLVEKVRETLDRAQ